MKSFKIKDFKILFSSLDEKSQMKLCIKLLRKCLHLWEDYSQNHDLSFIDLEEELEIELGDSLIIDTIVEIEKNLLLNTGMNNPLNNLYELMFFYESTLEALKREDIFFPEEMEKIFYSIYNLLKGSMGDVVTRFNESIFYLSAIQVIEALLLTNSLTETELIKFIEDSITIS